MYYVAERGTDKIISAGYATYREVNHYRDYLASCDMVMEHERLDESVAHIGNYLARYEIVAD